jgi:TolB protein
MKKPACVTALVVAAAWLQAQSPPAQSPARQFEEAVTLIDSRNDCSQAVPLLERVAASADRALAARALIYLGTCYERLGNERARQAYRKVIREYSEQRAAAAQARTRLAALDRSSRAPRRLTLRPLWPDLPRGFEVYGRPSIDGRVLPMADEQGRLTLRGVDLRALRPPFALGLASDGLPECKVQTSVVLSPDAAWAAFSCEITGAGHELRVVRTDSSRPRQRRLSPEYLEPIEWALPGVLLVQRNANGRYALALVDVASGEIRDVTTLDAPVDAAAVSPDGAWITFDGPDRWARHDVYLVASRGGTPAVVAEGPSDDLLPGWSPDGRGVLFVSDRTGSPGLWLQPVARGRAEGAAQVLSQDLGRVADVWAATRGGAFIYFRQTGLVSVAVATLDAEGRSREAPSTSGSGQYGGTMMPTWSPDGGRLAYLVFLTGSRAMAIGVRDLESASERLIRPDLREFYRPRWAPDGRNIAVRGRDTAGRYGVHVIDPDSGRSTPVKLMALHDEDRLGPAQWAPGGRLVVRVQDALLRLDPDSGAEQHMLDLPPGSYAFDVSPADGAIAFLRRGDARSGTVVVVHTPDGTTREVLRAEPGEFVREIVWAPDGRSLFFTRTPGERSGRDEAAWPSVWRVDAATGEALPLGLRMDRLRDLAVSPDGRRLAFTTGAPLREPWILENYLPPPRHGQPGR